MEDTENFAKAELAFAIFCIENVAERLHADASAVYDAFTKSSDILESYIIPCYDVLHTQGRDYIVNDLIDLMKEKEVKV